MDMVEEASREDMSTITTDSFDDKKRPEAPMYPQYPPAMYGYPPNYPPSQLYAPYQLPQQEDTYQAFLTRQYQINELQRQEELRRAEHERRMAEAQHMRRQQEEQTKRVEVEKQRKRLMEGELDPTCLRGKEEAKKPTTSFDPMNPPREVFLSNEQLLAQFATLKKSIVSRSDLTDDELLEMFEKLQVLQDILEKRDVEIDAAQLLARSYRRQSHREDTSRVRRRSSVELKKTVSRQSSLESSRGLSRQSSVDSSAGLEDKSEESTRRVSRQSSLNSQCDSGENWKQLSRRQSSLRDARESCDVESDDSDRPSGLEDTMHEDHMDAGGESDDVETDPRAIELQRQISSLSNSILSKSFSDRDLLAMFDQLDELKRELAHIKGIEVTSEGIGEGSESFSMFSSERDEMTINPQYREIKKLKPVLRRLLPSRTHFSKIEELFHCEVDDPSVSYEEAYSPNSLEIIGEDEESESASSNVTAEERLGTSSESADTQDNEDEEEDEDENQNAVPIHPEVREEPLGSGQCERQLLEVEKQLLEEPNSTSPRKGRRNNGSGFFMGNPMTNGAQAGGSVVSDATTRDSSSSVSSMSSIDRLPRQGYLNSNLDIFQSKRKASVDKHAH